MTTWFSYLKQTDEVKEAGPVQSGVLGYISQQLNQDVHASIRASEYVSRLHDYAEKFDPRAEEVNNWE